MRREVLIAVVVGVALAGALSASDITELTGRLNVLWGDRQSFEGPDSPLHFSLRTDSGDTIGLELGDGVLAASGGLSHINGARVRVRIAQPDAKGRRPVRSLQVLEGIAKAERSVAGSQPWVSLLCKFSDVSAEPENLSYFQNMYGTTYPGLDHYWREVSYDTINVVGSAAQQWRVLPHTRSYYAHEDPPSSGNWVIDLDAMFDDCTALHDLYVQFPDYVGINMMFNAEFGPYAWGGSRFASLDGQSRSWRVTWEPPWGYADITVMAHEMGHGFGFPHSNNADGDGDPYDNVWDVMSDTWHYWISDSTYGILGKHTISHHKDLAGWIPSDEIVATSGDGIWTVTLDNLEDASVTGDRMIKIPIPGGSTYYTVETRDLVGYDGNLPGNAVIIHEVDLSRKEDAWLIDPLNPGNSADEGAMWRVGECFDDTTNDIHVCVDTATTDGFQVTVTVGDVAGFVFSDGFEDGDWCSWSSPACS